MLILSRAAVAAGSLFAVVYAAVALYRHKVPSYFRCVLLGLAALLLANLYYLVLNLNSRLANDFTVGIFGEVALCLFLLNANVRLVPREEGEKKRPFSAFGLVAALAAAGLFVGSMAVRSSWGNIVRGVIYILAVCPCLYIGVGAVVNRKANPFKTGLRPFNAVFSGALLLVGVLQLLSAMRGGFILDVVMAVVGVLTGVAVAVSVILLRKGLDPWVM